jgi:hypothetical protein
MSQRISAVVGLLLSLAAIVLVLTDCKHHEKEDGGNSTHEQPQPPAP